MYLRLATAASLFFSLLAAPALAQWQPPADGKFTEDRLKIYLDTQRDWLEELASLVRIAAGTKSGGAGAPTVSDVASLYQACLNRHHITQQEFQWMTRSTSNAWGAVAYLDGSFKSQKDHLDDQMQELDAQLAEAHTRLATYQEAQKNGWRILAPDDRDALVKIARAQQSDALQEVQERQDDIDARESEAKGDEADAKTAEDESQNPPSDVSPDDRAEYVQNKKNEARAAREAASEARTQEADEKKALAEAQALADAASHRAEHPEIPVTADDKSQAKVSPNLERINPEE